jgi:hypothetical protein
MKHAMSPPFVALAIPDFPRLQYNPGFAALSQYVQTVGNHRFV